MQHSHNLTKSSHLKVYLQAFSRAFFSRPSPLDGWMDTNSRSQKSKCHLTCFCLDSGWQESVRHIILKFFLGLKYDQIPWDEIVSEWEYRVKMGILFQRLPEGKLHQTKQKSHWSLRWQMETLNNCITAIIFGNGIKLISPHCNVSVSYRLCI